MVVAEGVDVSVESANRESFGYALDKVPASDRDAAGPAIVPGAAVGDGGFDGSRVDLRQRSGVADLEHLTQRLTIDDPVSSAGSYDLVESGVWPVSGVCHHPALTMLRST